MKIAMISTPFESTPPLRYGGTERIVSLLTEGLAERGHEVTLFATGDSKTRARLVYFFETARRQMYTADDVIYHLGMAFSQVEGFNIVHNHDSFCGIPFCGLCPIPSLTTIHNSMTLSPGDKIYAAGDLRIRLFKAYPSNNYVAISENQRKAVPAGRVYRVYNAIAYQDFPFSPDKEDFFLWIGKIWPGKGLHSAIEVARRADLKLRIAGRPHPSHLEYFQNLMERVDGQKIQYLGEVSDEERLDLYKRARALLFPIQWDEPFGLVMVEAMACGTPVLAFGRGSVPEIIDDGRTGFVVSEVEEMMEAVKKVDSLDPRVCRKWVEEHFSAEVMIKAYEEVYQNIMNREKT